MKNEKGFALIEVLIVSITVATALIVLYVQFRTVDSNFENSINYNNVNSLYKTNVIKSFIGSNIGNYDALLGSSENNYVDLKSCDADELRKEVCVNLLLKLGVSEIIYTDKDLDKFLSKIKSNEVSSSMKGFSKYIEYKSDKTDNYSRIIVKYSDDTFATLVLGGSV